MARWTSWLPLLLLASALFWTTALGFGSRSLRAFFQLSGPAATSLQDEGECFELSVGAQASASAIRDSLRLAQPCLAPPTLEGVRMNLLDDAEADGLHRGGTSGVDVERGETPYGQTAW